MRRVRVGVAGEGVLVLLVAEADGGEREPSQRPGGRPAAEHRMDGGQEIEDLRQLRPGSVGHEQGAEAGVPELGQKRNVMCEASADPDATADITRPAGGPTTQEGLVNVNVSDIDIQAPIGVVANVCDVNVAVLVGLVGDDATPCTGSADPTSVITLD